MNNKNLEVPNMYNTPIIPINITYMKPQNLIQPLTKVTSALFNEQLDFSHITYLNVGSIKANKQKYPATVLIGSFSLNTNPLCAFDREVFNGICTLYSNDQTIMTAKQIYTAMAGKSTTSQKILNKITDSISKMQAISFSLNWEDHAKMKHLPGQYNYDFNGYLLPICDIKLQCGEKVIPGYRLVEEPILLTYAKAVKQISTTSTQMLNNLDISNTEENIILKNYLIRHVEHIRCNSHWNSTITFEKLFKTCGIQKDSRLMERKRTTIKKILDNWKGLGYIANYRTQKCGNKYYSLTIFI